MKLLMSVVRDDGSVPWSQAVEAGDMYASYDVDDTIDMGDGREIYIASFAIMSCVRDKLPLVVVANAS